MARKHTLLNAEILRQAAVDAFRKLDPRVMMKNPVMFVVEVGSLLTSVLLIEEAAHQKPIGFDLQITLWLWFTVLFANFAEAVAEGRGKAQADTLRKAKGETMAYRLKADGSTEAVSSSQLRLGDIIRVEAGQFIAGDGEVIEGVASVDESAITGESAPVIREAGGDRSAVTGGTRVLSDWMRIRITSNPGETFLDRMIALVEGAQRQKTPNEIALSILLAGLTIIFLLAVVTLQPFAIYSHAPQTIFVLVSLLVCLIPTTIGALLSAIGIAGMDRLVQYNVLAMSGRAVEAAGDVNTLLLDKTGTITLGNRQATEFFPAPDISTERLADAAQLASLSDETPEGRSIVVLAKEKYNLRGRDLTGMQCTFVPFSAQTRMSGVDLPGTKIRKGSSDAIARYLEQQGSMVGKGETAIQNGDWEETGRMVQTSLRLAPNSPEVLRLAARYCTHKELAQGMTYWQSVQAMIGLTLDDQYEYARLALLQGRTDLSANLLSSLVATNQSDPKILRLVTMHSAAVGNVPEAIRAARAWLRSSTTNSDAELTLGGLLFGSAEPQERREGRGLLWGLALGTSPHRASAIETLAASPELSRGENQVLLNQVENNTNHLATSYALRIKLHPEQKAALIDQMITEVVATGTTRQLALAAAWLADNSEIRRVLDVLPLKVAEKNPTLMTARLQALMELGDMVEVKRFLEMDTSKVEPFLLHCLRAYAAQTENKPQLVAGHFESALTAAGNHPARLRFVAGYAERIGQPQAAIAAYRRLMNWPPATMDAGKRILQLASQLNDTRAVRDTLRQLAAFMPGERGIALANAYMAALLNDVTPRTKAELIRMAETDPVDPELSLVLAFVEWRLGEPGPALSRLESLKPEWLKAEPRRQIIYAAILGANDQREAARRLARTVEVATLRPEEVDLVKQWRE